MTGNYTIVRDFITPDQEAELLRLIQPLMPKRRKGHGGRNEILRYGSTAPYSDNHVSEEIPDWLMVFSDRISFDHVSVNEYYRGQEIPWHIDSPGSGEEITVLSLLSGGVLEFRKDNQRINIETPQRALLRFSGPLRWDWEHRLWASQRRYSIVFRNSAV